MGFFQRTGDKIRELQKAHEEDKEKRHKIKLERLQKRTEEARARVELAKEESKLEKYGGNRSKGMSLGGFNIQLRNPNTMPINTGGMGFGGYNEPKPTVKKRRKLKKRSKR